MQITSLQFQLRFTDIQLSDMPLHVYKHSSPWFEYTLKRFRKALFIGIDSKKRQNTCRKKVQCMWHIFF